MYKRTNIELDLDLLREALAITNCKTIKDVVHYSLREVIKLHKRRSMLDLEGKVEWVGDLDNMRSID